MEAFHDSTEKANAPAPEYQAEVTVHAPAPQFAHYCSLRIMTGAQRDLRRSAPSGIPRMACLPSIWTSTYHTQTASLPVTLLSHRRSTTTVETILDQEMME